MLSIKAIDDFLKGQEDCARGRPADPKGSEDYIRGYGEEYQQQQIADAKTS